MAFVTRHSVAFDSKDGNTYTLTIEEDGGVDLGAVPLAAEPVTGSWNGPEQGPGLLRLSGRVAIDAQGDTTAENLETALRGAAAGDFQVRLSDGSGDVLLGRLLAPKTQGERPQAGQHTVVLHVDDGLDRLYTKAYTTTGNVTVIAFLADAFAQTGISAPIKVAWEAYPKQITTGRAIEKLEIPMDQIRYKLTGGATVPEEITERYIRSVRQAQDAATAAKILPYPDGQVITYGQVLDEVVQAFGIRIALRGYWTVEHRSARYGTSASDTRTVDTYSAAGAYQLSASVPYSADISTRIAEGGVSQFSLTPYSVYRRRFMHGTATERLSELGDFSRGFDASGPLDWSTNSGQAATPGNNQFGPTMRLPVETGFAADDTSAAAVAAAGDYHSFTTDAINLALADSISIETLATAVPTSTAITYQGRKWGIISVQWNENSQWYNASTGSWGASETKNPFLLQFGTPTPVTFNTGSIPDAGENTFTIRVYHLQIQSGESGDFQYLEYNNINVWYTSGSATGEAGERLTTVEDTSPFDERAWPEVRVLIGDGPETASPARLRVTGSSLLTSDWQYTTAGSNTGQSLSEFIGTELLKQYSTPAVGFDWAVLSENLAPIEIDGCAFYNGFHYDTASLTRKYRSGISQGRWVQVRQDALTLTPDEVDIGLFRGPVLWVPPLQTPIAPTLKGLEYSNGQGFVEISWSDPFSQVTQVLVRSYEGEVPQDEKDNWTDPDTGGTAIFFADVTSETLPHTIPDTPDHATEPTNGFTLLFKRFVLTEVRFSYDRLPDEIYRIYQDRGKRPDIVSAVVGPGIWNGSSFDAPAHFQADSDTLSIGYELVDRGDPVPAFSSPTIVDAASGTFSLNIAEAGEKDLYLKGYTAAAGGGLGGPVFGPVPAGPFNFDLAELGDRLVRYGTSLGKADGPFVAATAYTSVVLNAASPAPPQQLSEGTTLYLIDYDDATDWVAVTVDAGHTVGSKTIPVLSFTGFEAPNGAFVSYEPGEDATIKILNNSRGLRIFRDSRTLSSAIKFIADTALDEDLPKGSKLWAYDQENPGREFGPYTTTAYVAAGETDVLISPSFSASPVVNGVIVYRDIQQLSGDIARRIPDRFIGREPAGIGNVGRGKIYQAAFQEHPTNENILTDSGPFTYTQEFNPLLDIPTEGDWERSGFHTTTSTPILVELTDSGLLGKLSGFTEMTLVLALQRLGTSYNHVYVRFASGHFIRLLIHQDSTDKYYFVHKGVTTTNVIADLGSSPAGKWTIGVASISLTTNLMSLLVHTEDDDEFIEEDVSFTDDGTWATCDEIEIGRSSQEARFGWFQVHDKALTLDEMKQVAYYVAQELRDRGVDFPEVRSVTRRLADTNKTAVDANTTTIATHTTQISDNGTAITLEATRARSYEGSGKLGATTGTHSGSVTQINLGSGDDAAAFPLQDDDLLRIVYDSDGAGTMLEEKFQINTDFSTGATTIQVDSNSITGTIPAGTPVFGVPDKSIGLVQIGAGNVLLSASAGSGGEVVAAINLSASLIDGARIQVTGTTTFASGYNPSDTRAIFSQATAPTTRVAGDPLQANDLWIDEGNGNVIKIWNGSAWVERADTQATEKTYTFVQTTAPTQRPNGDALEQGDKWNDSDDGYNEYVWTGSAWTRNNTQIDGGVITTGLVSANRIDVDNLVVKKILIGSEEVDAENDGIYFQSGSAILSDGLNPDVLAWMDTDGVTENFHIHASYNSAGSGTDGAGSVILSNAWLVPELGVNIDGNLIVQEEANIQGTGGLRVDNDFYADGMKYPAAGSGSTGDMLYKSGSSAVGFLSADNSTVEVSGSTLRVKSSGIDTAQIAASAVDTAQLANDSVDHNKLDAGTLGAKDIIRINGSNTGLEGKTIQEILNELSTTADMVSSDKLLWYDVSSGTWELGTIADILAAP